MKRKSRKLRKANGGFSLVEVLVAVLILAAITIPVLKGLVTGTNINAKSRKVLNATNIAQNLLEEMRGNKVAGTETELAALGYYPETISGVTCYVKTIKDIVGEGNNYHARIILDPNTYRTTYNKDAMADVAGVDLDKDAVYIQSGSYEKAMGLLDLDGLVSEFVDEFKIQTGGTEYTESQIKSALNREITMNILKADGGGAGVSCNITLSITYKATLGGTTVEMKNPDGVAIYKNVSAGNELRNLYFTYEPLYEGASEHIIINNKNEAPVTVYIMKQSGVDGEEREASYKVDVDVYESETAGSSWHSDSEFLAATQIRTNLDMPMGSLTGTTLSQATYNYHRGTQTVSSATDNEGVRTLLRVSEPAGTDIPGIYNNLYGVTVEVYLASGVPEAEMFNSKYKLVTLDGSKLK